MKLTSLNTATFKLDGGAMFGVVPKTMWQKVYPANENNLCTWALRCLLIETENKKIIIDCGIGDKQDEKFLSHYYIENYRTFNNILQEYKLSADNITDVILTHLHFDHCGGAVSYNNDKTKLEPTFKNATYWIGKQQWNSANDPNPREKASYLNENYRPLLDEGKIKFIDNKMQLFENVSVKIIHGHTAGQVIPHIDFNGKTIVYMADFIPTSFHIPLPWIISYDIAPLLSMNEKERFLNVAAENNYILFFEHDNYNECCTVKKTEKGIRVDKIGTLKEFL